MIINVVNMAIMISMFNMNKRQDARHLATSHNLRKHG